MPDRNDEYAFYQILVGAFPFFEHEVEPFVGRVQDYMLKAIREAKVYTAWLRPNSAYEEACTNFVQAVLQPAEQNRFLQEFLPFQRRVAFYGMLNSLSQTLLKIASPGVPDFYQGTELWDLSLVDPDNRRPVDFEQRQADLNAIQTQAKTDILALIRELFATKEDGRIKLFLTTQAIKARNRYLEVFQQGNYQPLEVSGQFQDQVIAFARSTGDRTILTIAPRFFTRLVDPGVLPLGDRIWQDTRIHLPSGLGSHWQDAITTQTVQADGTMAIAEILQHFPVALLVSQPSADA